MGEAVAAVEVDRRRRIVIPIYDCVDFSNMEMTLTSDHVAIALIAASKVTGASVMAVAEGTRGNRHHPEVLRARAYAALALRAVFEGIDPRTVAHVVGVRTPATAYSYLKTLDEQMHRSFLDWWDDKAFMRVVEAIEALPIPTDTQTACRAG